MAEYRDTRGADGRERRKDEGVSSRFLKVGLVQLGGGRSWWRAEAREQPPIGTPRLLHRKVCRGSVDWPERPRPQLAAVDRPSHAADPTLARYDSLHLKRGPEGSKQQPGSGLNRFPRSFTVTSFWVGWELGRLSPGSQQRRNLSGGKVPRLRLRDSVVWGSLGAAGPFSNADHPTDAGTVGHEQHDYSLP